MAQNPLLGNRISLVSKKNIRYEGTLYSINEANATVALQNVKSFGTEGREKVDAATTFVAPQDAVHPYLLFRGCDIRDLHVHEAAKEDAAEGDAPPAEAPVPLPSPPPQPQQQQQQNKPATKTTPQAPKNQAEEKQATLADNKKKNEKENQDQQRPKQYQQHQGGRGGEQQQYQGGRGGDQQHQGGRGGDQQHQGGRGGAYNRRPRKPNPAHQVGTGASLLNRKARGTVDGGPETPEEEFDFQSKLAEFTKEGTDDDDNNDDEEEDAGDTPKEATATAYEKDDFFDSISCDALDRQSGLDNRLRGAQERSLNTETFGAVALNSQRRRRRGGGRGGGGGRGRGGRGRGRGRGRGGRGRNNARWHTSTGNPGNNNPGYGNNNKNAQPQAAAS